MLLPVCVCWNAARARTRKVVQDVWKNMRSIVCCCDNFVPIRESVGDCSSDLNHLCKESAVGAEVQAARIPIDQVVSELCGRRALDPLMLALHGGEDFELLFTVKPENVGKLPKRVDGVPITCIGTIKEESYGVKISEGSRVWNLEPGGWEHFKDE